MKKYLFILSFGFLCFSNNILFSQEFNYEIVESSETGYKLSFDTHVFHFNYAYKWDFEFAKIHSVYYEDFSVLIEKTSSNLLLKFISIYTRFYFKKGVFTVVQD